MAAVADSPRAFDFRSPVRASYDQLDEVIAASRARIVRWRKEHAQAVQLEAQRAIQDLNRERQNLEDLKADLANINDLSEAAARIRGDGVRLGEVVRESLDAAARRSQVAARTKRQLLELHETRRQELRQEEAALADKRRAAEAQSSEVDALLGLYRSKLGLNISHSAPQTVKFTFTLVDEADPAREFWVTLGVADAQAAGYRVLECKPAVPGVAAIAALLNAEPSANAALPRFICAMRRCFQEASGLGERKAWAEEA